MEQIGMLSCILPFDDGTSSPEGMEDVDGKMGWAGGGMEARVAA